MNLRRILLSAFVVVVLAGVVLVGRSSAVIVTGYGLGLVIVTTTSPAEPG